MQVKDLQPPYPEKEVRIETKRGDYGSNIKFLDGVVKKAWQGDGGVEDWGVELYSPTYDSTRTHYVSSNDLVTEPTRLMNAQLAAEGDHEREMAERARKQQGF
ncbi:hypothetical protein ACFQ9J_32775 [Streptomyces sp. NPDC056529]|uniref:hypothetical protein n=1 Tax=Streptomyces sp. NPDC056529 TaxID=3345855 RepID=UPI0036A432B6